MKRGSYVYHVERHGISGGPTFTSWTEAIRYAKHMVDSGVRSISIWKEAR